MEKVSTWAAAGKATLLVKARIQYYAAYAVLFIAFYVGTYVLTPIDPQAIEGRHLLLGVFNLVVGTGLTLSLHHFSIGSCRNMTSFFPADRVSGYFGYLLATCALGAIVVVASIIGALPLIVWSASVVGEGEIWSGRIVQYGMLVALMAAVGLVPVVRLGFILSAAAIGDKCTYSGTWRMTKGHTIRLILWLGVLFSPSFFAGWLATSTQIASPDAIPEVSTPLLFLQYGIGLVTSIWGAAFGAVLYEDFRKRDAAMIDE